MKQMRWMMMALAASLVMAVAGLNALADNRYSEREIRDLANRNGYQFGMREGRYDRREGNRFDAKRNRAYKDGKYGYRDDYHHDGTYKNGFREGFLAGYEDGYNGRSSGRRNNDDYDNRRGRRNDDDYDYRRGRRNDDDDDYRRGRDNRDNRNGRNGRPWWDILTGQDGGVYDDRGNRRRP